MTVKNLSPKNAALFAVKICGVFLSIPWACSAQQASGSQSKIPEAQISELSVSEQGKAMHLTTAKEVDEQSVRQQQQARAVVLSANNSMTNTTGGIANSEFLRQESDRQMQLNQSAVKSTTPAAINEIKAYLPKLGQISGQLKYGEHIVVSKEGPEIIELIRSLTSTPQKNTAQALSKIQNFASQGKPEAINFLGFAFENGLFGLKRSPSQAVSYYERAAAEKYQPALYNLAVIEAYGKSGPVNAARAEDFAVKAQGLANDTSGRVCGLASFLAFRSGNRADAQLLAKGCPSPLANLSRATNGNAQSLPERVSWLRTSIATGADDGYTLIVKVSQQHVWTDRNFTFCKYALVNRYRTKPKLDNLRAHATQCFDRVSKGMGTDQEVAAMRDQVIAGISTFVPTEIAALSNMRKSNRFHFSWSVPYLPFGQSETDLFESLLLKANQK